MTCSRSTALRRCGSSTDHRFGAGRLVEESPARVLDRRCGVFPSGTEGLRTRCWSQPDSNSRSRRDGQRYRVRSLKRRLDRRGMTSGAARNGLRFSLFYSVGHSTRPTAHSGRAGCPGPRNPQRARPRARLRQRDHALSRAGQGHDDLRRVALRNLSPPTIARWSVSSAR
jgi:hypothetical protein